MLEEESGQVNKINLKRLNEEDLAAVKSMLSDLVIKSSGGLSDTEKEKLDLEKIRKEMEALEVCNSVTNYEQALERISGKPFSTLEKFKLRLGLVGTAGQTCIYSDGKTGEIKPVVVVLSGGEKTLRHELVHVADVLTGRHKQKSNRWVGLSRSGLYILTMVTMGGAIVAEMAGKRDVARPLEAVGLVAIILGSGILLKYKFDPDERRARGLRK